MRISDAGEILIDYPFSVTTLSKKTIFKNDPLRCWSNGWGIEATFVRSRIHAEKICRFLIEDQIGNRFTFASPRSERHHHVDIVKN
jgi:hypothetical protein